MEPETDALRARKRHQLLTWRKLQLRKVARAVAARGDLRLIRSPRDLDTPDVPDDDSGGPPIDDVDDLPVDAGL